MFARALDYRRHLNPIIKLCKKSLPVHLCLQDLKHSISQNSTTKASRINLTRYYQSCEHRLHSSAVG